jgi:predicted exporter
VKELLMFVFTGVVTGFVYFGISVTFIIYSGSVSNSKMINRDSFSLLQRLWVLFCIGIVSLIPVSIFMWSPLDTVEQLARFGAFIGFCFVEIKFKAIITLSRTFINGYYVSPNE